MSGSTPKPETSAPATPQLSRKELRKKFGLAEGPMPCTRLLGREMDHDFTVPAVALMILDDNAGTATGANVYGGNFGKGYDPEAYRHPLPAEGDEKWKKWKKKGYEDWTARIPEFDVLQDCRKPEAQPEAQETPSEEEAPAPAPAKGRKAAKAK